METNVEDRVVDGSVGKGAVIEAEELLEGVDVRVAHKVLGLFEAVRNEVEEPLLLTEQDVRRFRRGEGLLEERHLVRREEGRVEDDAVDCEVHKVIRMELQLKGRGHKVADDRGQGLVLRSHRVLEDSQDVHDRDLLAEWG